MDDRYCFYKDVDMIRLKKDFDDIHKVFNEIALRFERKDSLEISTSVFNSISDYHSRLQNPQKFYHFVKGDTKIFISRPSQSRFLVFLISPSFANFSYPKNSVLNDFASISPGSDTYQYKTYFTVLDNAVDVFCRSVSSFLFTRVLEVEENGLF